MKTSKTLWTAEVVGNKLTISMDLPTICAGSDSMNCFKITDLKVFGKEIVNTLLNEEEDGTTPIHRMMDTVIYDALENGAEGVEEEE